MNLLPALGVVILACILTGCISPGSPAHPAPVPQPPDFNGSAVVSGSSGMAISFRADSISTSSPEAREQLFEGLTLSTQRARYTESLPYFDRAIALDGNFSEAWIAKGVALNNLNRFDEALTCFDHALAINPDETSVWHLKCMILKNAGRAGEAAACSQKAASLDPRYAAGRS